MGMLHRMRACRKDELHNYGHADGYKRGPWDSANACVHQVPGTVASESERLACFCPTAYSGAIGVACMNTCCQVPSRFTHKDEMYSWLVIVLPSLLLVNVSG